LGGTPHYRNFNNWRLRAEFFNLIRGVRGYWQMRVNGMNPSKEDKGDRDEKQDRAEDEKPRLVPDDLENVEGDEEEHEEPDLPPAMPPKV
jgi:hypothetical protein